MAAVPERPGYEPGKWNTPEAQGSHNCYDYACDDDRKRDPGHKSQPGKKSNHPLKIPYECADVAAAAVADGLKESTKDAQCPSPYCWKVALFILPRSARSPNGDYHWVRQDKGGGWSQKHGASPATDRDDGPNHDPITDPSTADIRRPSTGERYNFCNLYFCACRGDVQIAMAEPRIPAGGALACALVNSGAPDPCWTFSKSDVAVAASKLAGLTRLDAPGKWPSTSIVFSIKAGKGAKGLPGYAVVADDVIRTRDAKGKWSYWRDEKGLRNWLISSASRSEIGGQIEALFAAAGSVEKRKRPRSRGR